MDAVTSADRGGRWRPALWGGVTALLLAPLLAMRFTDEVRWTAWDFAAAATILFGAALAFEVAARILRRPLHLALAGAVILAAVLAIWVEGAVGLL